MVAVIQESRYPGGTVLQITREGKEVVETKPTSYLSHLPLEVLEAAVQRSCEPINEILKADRR